MYKMVKFVGVFLILISPNFSVFAQSAAEISAVLGAIEQQDTVAREQQLNQQQEQLRRQREITESSNVKLDEKDQAEQDYTEYEKIKLKLVSVKFKGASDEHLEELKKLFEPYLNKQSSFADIQRAVDAATKYYKEKGLILSRAFLEPQELDQKQAKLEVTVVEGYVDKTDLEGNIPRQSRQLLEGLLKKIAQVKPLDQKVLERYVLLANDIYGVRVNAVLKPSETETGAADLTFVVKQKRINTLVSFDNNTSISLGKDEWSAGLYVNNIFWGSQTSGQIVRSVDKGRLKFYEVRHSQYIGYEGLKLDLFHTETKTDPDYERINIRDLFTLGTNRTMFANFSYPIIRGRKEDLTLKLGVNGVNSKSVVFNQLTLFDENIRTLTFGLDYFFIDRFKGANFLNGLYSKGVDGLGAGLVIPSRLNGTLKYNKINIDYTRSQNLGNVSDWLTKFSFLWNIYLQGAFNNLLAYPEFAVGGLRNGRGYEIGEITGDNGASGSFNLEYTISTSDFNQRVYRLAPFFSDNFLSILRPFIFYDIGATWQKNNNIAGLKTRQSIASTGIGTKFGINNYVNGQLIWAKPLTNKVLNEGNRKASLLGIISISNFNSFD